MNKLKSILISIVAIPLLIFIVLTGYLESELEREYGLRNDDE